MIRETFPVGVLQCNCTVIGDEASREGIVVDPGADLPRVLAVLERHRLTLKQILITHAHFDHIAGAQQLSNLTGAAIGFNQADLPLAAMLNEQPAWVGLNSPPYSRYRISTSTCETGRKPESRVCRGPFC